MSADINHKAKFSIRWACALRDNCRSLNVRLKNKLSFWIVNCDEHRPAPLWRLCDSGAVYNVNVYKLTYLVTCPSPFQSLSLPNVSW